MSLELNRYNCLKLRRKTDYSLFLSPGVLIPDKQELQGKNPNIRSPHRWSVKGILLNLCWHEQSKRIKGNSAYMKSIYMAAQHWKSLCSSLDSLIQSPLQQCFLQPLLQRKQKPCRRWVRWFQHRLLSPRRCPKRPTI